MQKSVAITYRQGLWAAMLGLFAIIIFILRPQTPAVFLLWLAALGSIVVRFRFNNTKGLLVELAVWVFLALLIDGIFLLAYPVAMLLIYEGRWPAAAAPIMLWLVFAPFDAAPLAAALYAVGTGLLLYGWHLSQYSAQQELDAHRERLYGYEREREDLLETQDGISRLSVLTERDRIAQKLHDDLGHELTGANLALRAFEVKCPDSAGEPSFQSIKEKLEASVEQLRESVELNRPEESLGDERFRKLIERFDFCPLDHRRNGTFEKLTPTHWHLMASVLKEAFTNVQKHSRATRVEVELYADETLVRLLVRNDGVQSESAPAGMGLRFMRRRLEGVGGTLSVHTDYHFTLVCVIPITFEEVES